MSGREPGTLRTGLYLTTANPVLLLGSCVRRLPFLALLFYSYPFDVVWGFKEARANKEVEGCYAS